MNDKTVPAKKEESQGISRFLPILSWLPKYDRTWLKGDLIARSFCLGFDGANFPGLCCH